MNVRALVINGLLALTCGFAGSVVGLLAFGESISQQGPPGPQGATGPPGSVGPDGAQGPPGSVGEDRAARAKLTDVEDDLTGVMARVGNLERQSRGPCFPTRVVTDVSVSEFTGLWVDKQTFCLTR